MKLILTIGIFVAATLAIAAFLLASFEHMVFETVPSPMGHSVAVIYSLGENDPIEYGTGIVLAPSWMPVPQLWKNPVFRGRCWGKNSSLLWRSDQEFLVSCEQWIHVDTKLEESSGILVSYENATRSG